MLSVRVEQRCVDAIFIRANGTSTILITELYHTLLTQFLNYFTYFFDSILCYCIVCQYGLYKITQVQEKLRSPVGKSGGTAGWPAPPAPDGADLRRQTSHRPPASGFEIKIPRDQNQPSQKPIFSCGNISTKEVVVVEFEEKPWTSRACENTDPQWCAVLNIYLCLWLVHSYWHVL